MWRRPTPENEKILLMIYLDSVIIGFVIMYEYPADMYHPELYDEKFRDLTPFNQTTHLIDNSHIPIFKNPYCINYRYLFPEYRNKGYGTRILKFIMKKYEFTIYPTNEAAIKSVIKAGCKSYGYLILNKELQDKIYRSK